jgi:hypothetical protein
MDESRLVKGAVSQAYTDRTLRTLFSRVGGRLHHMVKFL